MSNDSVKKNVPIIALLGIVVLVLLGSSFYFIHKTPHPQADKKQTNITPTKPAWTVKTSEFTVTPTLAPGQKSNYIYYINAVTATTKPGTLVLHPSDAGKTFSVPTKSVILLDFSTINSGKNFTYVSFSPQNIFKPSGKPVPFALPKNYLGGYVVYRIGIGKITVTQAQ